MDCENSYSMCSSFNIFLQFSSGSDMDCENSYSMCSSFIIFLQFSSGSILDCLTFSSNLGIIECIKADDLKLLLINFGSVGSFK